MKQIFTLSLVLCGFAAFSQQKSERTNTSQPVVSEQQKNESTVAPITRTAPMSAQARTSEPAPLPYDVNDKYMGRAAEFLGNLTVSKLPSDFPVYEKQWSLKEYNGVVTAFYYNHLDIVREGVRKKLELLKH
jgi:hypothetical protein